MSRYNKMRITYKLRTTSNEEYYAEAVPKNDWYVDLNKEQAYCYGMDCMGGGDGLKYLRPMTHQIKKEIKDFAIRHPEEYELVPDAFGKRKDKKWIENGNVVVSISIDRPICSRKEELEDRFNYIKRALCEKQYEIAHEASRDWRLKDLLFSDFMLRAVSEAGAGDYLNWLVTWNTTRTGWAAGLSSYIDEKGDHMFC